MVYRTCALIYSNRGSSVIGLFRTSSNHRDTDRWIDAAPALWSAQPPRQAPLLSSPFCQRLCQRGGAQRERDPHLFLLSSFLLSFHVLSLDFDTSRIVAVIRRTLYATHWTTVRFNTRVFTNQGANLIEVLEHFRSANEL